MQVKRNTRHDVELTKYDHIKVVEIQGDTIIEVYEEPTDTDNDAFSMYTAKNVDKIVFDGEQ
jgi:hypothetical protein